MALSDKHRAYTLLSSLKLHAGQDIWPHDSRFIDLDATAYSFMLTGILASRATGSARAIFDGVTVADVR